MQQKGYMIIVISQLVPLDRTTSEGARSLEEAAMSATAHLSSKRLQQ